MLNARWLTVRSTPSSSDSRVERVCGTGVDLRPSRQKCQATADRRCRLAGIPTPGPVGRPLNMIRWDLAYMSEVVEQFLVQERKMKMDANTVYSVCRYIAGSGKTVLHLACAETI